MQGHTVFICECTCKHCKVETLTCVEYIASDNVLHTLTDVQHLV